MDSELTEEITRLTCPPVLWILLSRRYLSVMLPDGSTLSPV